eukprot:1975176-Rhodomonas_salina.4
MVGVGVGEEHELRLALLAAAHERDLLVRDLGLAHPAARLLRARGGEELARLGGEGVDHAQVPHLAHRHQLLDRQRLRVEVQPQRDDQNLRGKGAHQCRAPHSTACARAGRRRVE